MTKPCILFIPDVLFYKMGCWKFFIDITLYQQDEWYIVGIAISNIFSENRARHKAEYSKRLIPYLISQEWPSHKHKWLTMSGHRWIIYLD